MEKLPIKRYFMALLEDNIVLDELNTLLQNEKSKQISVLIAYDDIDISAAECASLMYEMEEALFTEENQDKKTYFVILAIR